MIARRGFLTGILAAGIAPAILPQGSAMRLWVPSTTGVLTLEKLLAATRLLDANSAEPIVDPFGIRFYVTHRYYDEAVILNEHWMQGAERLS